MVVRVRVKRKGSFERLYGKILTSIRGPRKVKVGFPAGKANDVLDRAFFNEFGTNNIPERPFMRLGMKDARDDLRPQLRQASKAILTGKSDMRRALGKMGVLGQGAIQKSITNLASPPNAASTVQQKGSSNPLIDTGQMRQSVTWEIDE